MRNNHVGRKTTTSREVCRVEQIGIEVDIPISVIENHCVPLARRCVKLTATCDGRTLPKVIEVLHYVNSSLTNWTACQWRSTARRNVRWEGVGTPRIAPAAGVQRTDYHDQQRNSHNSMKHISLCESSTNVVDALQRTLAFLMQDSLRRMSLRESLLSRPARRRAHATRWPVDSSPIGNDKNFGCIVSNCGRRLPRHRHALNAGA